jgi:hypothetical protein
MLDGEPTAIPEAVLMRGAVKGLKYIEQLRECIERDEFPGLASQPDWVLETPAWCMDEEEDDLEGAEVYDG